MTRFKPSRIEIFRQIKLCKNQSNEGLQKILTYGRGYACVLMGGVYVMLDQINRACLEGTLNRARLCVEMEGEHTEMHCKGKI